MPYISNITLSDSAIVDLYDYDMQDSININIFGSGIFSSHSLINKIYCNIIGKGIINLHDNKNINMNIYGIVACYINNKIIKCQGIAHFILDNKK